MPRRKPARRNPAEEQFALGFHTVKDHPIFAPILAHARVLRYDGEPWAPDAWGMVSSSGAVALHPTRRADAPEWIYVIAHCLLHLGFGHFQPDRKEPEWSAACDCFVARFLADLKLGRPPAELQRPVEFTAESEEDLYRQFLEKGIPNHLRGFGVRGQACDRVHVEASRWRGQVDWQRSLGIGLSQAVASAVSVAGGYTAALAGNDALLTPGQRARRWFISSYPLLGALASAFDVIEDPILCGRMQITVAAVDDAGREIFLNPAAGLDSEECRFVMAHELLHSGLRHQARRRGRDPFLWNVACDFVINGWLVEMGLGTLPQVGALYDPQLKGESAEAIYDRLAVDLRRCRKLCTLAGAGMPDMLERRRPDWWQVGDGAGLDDFYRNCLVQGLSYHQDQGRGFLPAGLVEEIRALSQPPVPWDVELAQWFDAYFSPLEKVRSYARPSRRQSATPDIPRPRWVPALGAEDGRTFGVVLDTSGSMERATLAKALGAIASYAISREVPLVRVVFCDAVAYDQGYLRPEAIADRVQVRGRGGTVLQPGIDLLEAAEDFPHDGPLLIITDGYCDRVRVRREHAFLIPEGNHLPFAPKGKVFRIR